MKNFALFLFVRIPDQVVDDDFVIAGLSGYLLLEIRIDGLPLLYWRDNAEVDDLVTHNLKVCV